MIHISYNSPIKVYNSMVFNISKELCDHHYNLILEHFIIPKETPYPLVFNPHSSSPNSQL